MKVLVTGATGFIGRYLVWFLLNHGVQVRILVRKPHTDFPMEIEQRIGDLTKAESLQNIAKSIDCVFHLGGYSHAWHENSASEESIHKLINLEGTKTLFAECVKSGVKKFILFSSIKAVADTEYCIDETWTARPSTPYGQAKRAAEEWVLEKGRTHSMHICVLRLALVYGPGWKGNLFQMLQAVDKGYFLPIPPIKNHRSLVSVYDVCQAAYLAAMKTEANGKIYFVTDKKTYSTYEIYQAMRSALGLKTVNWYIPLWLFKIAARMGDGFEIITKKRFPLNSQALQKLFGSMFCNSQRIQRELGFEAHFPLDKLLPEIVKHYRGKRE